MTSEPRDPREARDSRPKPPPAPRGLGFWWLIWIGLMIWNIVAFWPKPNPEARIPYTTFLAQVRAHNVSHVRIADDQISGQFVHPFLWPQPASGVGAFGRSGVQ